MRTGIRLIKRCFVLGVILFLAACGVQESPGAIPTPTATPSSTKTVPISPPLNTPTVIKSSTSTATITPSTTPTLTSTLRPTPADCDAGFVVFLATTYSSEDQDKTGIYLACADGTFIQQIVSAVDVLPTTEWVINDLAISPDGQTLAFSSSGSMLLEPAPNQMYLVDMSNYRATGFYSDSDNDGFGQLSWSPDGEYIAYKAGNLQTQVSQIEILHINTQTVSMMVDNDPFGDFDELGWLSNGMQILYGAHIADNPHFYNGYLANINCDPDTHRCSITGQKKLDWMEHRNGSYQFSLVPGSSTIVRKYYSEGGFHIEVRDVLSGDLFTSVNLNELLSTLIYGRYPPSASSDGSQIAFAAMVDEHELYNDVFILSLYDRTLTNLTDGPLFEKIDVNEVLWIP
jgi:hypothetical protein